MDIIIDLRHRFEIVAVAARPHVSGFVAFSKVSTLVWRPFSKVCGYRVRFRRIRVDAKRNRNKMLADTNDVSGFVAFSKVSTLVWRPFSKLCGYRVRFRRIRVDAKRNRNKMLADTNESGYVWTGPLR